MTAQELAEATRDALWEDEQASRMLGLRVLSIAPGQCSVSMTVREDMLNGHGLCHGGIIATLADTAFGFACNTYNEQTLAAGFDINLIAGARKADVLTASARELSRSGRTGVYDVAVVNQRGEAVAAFRGRSYTVKGKPLVEGLPMGKPAAALLSGAG